MTAKKNDSLSDIWKIKKRGKRDSDRHKELVEKAIRKHGRNIITEYNIIKSRGDKKIKVPIKFLEKFRFKYGKINKEGGTGQGLDGEPGKHYKIGDKKGNAQGPAGNKEGERLFDAEITIDELVDILLEELNLPWMDPKNTTEIEVETEEISSIDRSGILPNLDLKRTILANMRRNASKGKACIGNFSKDDFRYKVWEDEKEYHSNAAVYLMMDRSGSMDQEKTFVAKSFYFWMVQFLKRRYKKVDLVFVAHDTKAFLVDEDDFFKISSSGGTACSSAFKLAYEHIKTHHPADKWNNYVFEFSDGDNWGIDNTECVGYVKKLLPLVRAIGYGEILLRGRLNSWIKEDMLLSNFFNKHINRTRFVSVQLKSKDDVFDALKKFFNIGSADDVLEDEFMD